MKKNISHWPADNQQYLSQPAEQSESPTISNMINQQLMFFYQTYLYLEVRKTYTYRYAVQECTEESCPTLRTERATRKTKITARSLDPFQVEE